MLPATPWSRPMRPRGAGTPVMLVPGLGGVFRIRQRQLLVEALATTPVRHQERDFLPQRLRSEIGRHSFRRTRDSKDALEKPAARGHFRRVSTCRQKT